MDNNSIIIRNHINRLCIENGCNPFQLDLLYDFQGDFKKELVKIKYENMEV